MKFLNLVITIGILIICFFNVEAQTNTIRIYDENKVLIREDFYYNDTIVRVIFYESNSIIKSDYHIIGNTKIINLYKDGVLYASSTTDIETGEVVGFSYNSKGLISGVHHSKNKKLHGIRHLFYDNGTLKQIREYNYGELQWEEKFPLP